MPAKGQDMATVASPRISLFLARLLGPIFVTIAILLNHNVWVGDWRVLITIFGWLAAIGGAQRIIWPQGTEAAIHWFLANPTSLVVAGIIWLVIGAALCFYGYFRESASGATR